MNQIPATIVAELCREINERASLSAAMDYLEARQPDILRYLMLEFMDGPSESGMRACHLGWLVFRAFELASESPIPRIAPSELAAKARDNQHLLVGTLTTPIDEFMQLMLLEMAGQPYLMQFVRQAVAVGLDKEAPPDRQRVGELVAIFLAVKTVVDALDAATN